MLGSRSTVPYSLYSETDRSGQRSSRPVPGQVPGYPPPSDVTSNHSGPERVGRLVTDLRLLVWVIIKRAGCAWVRFWAFNRLGRATHPSLKYFCVSIGRADRDLYNPISSFPLEVLLIPASGSSTEANARCEPLPALFQGCSVLFLRPFAT